MNRFTSALAASLFCLSAGVALAQGPGGEKGEHRMMKPCSQEADPAKCEANRKGMREAMKQAYESCKDKPDRRACMTEQYCAKSSDAAQCKAKAKERGEKMGQMRDRHQAVAEACTGKRGDELEKCYRAQREKSGHNRPQDKK